MHAVPQSFDRSSAFDAAIDQDATFSISIDLKVKDIVALWMEALHVGLGQHASKLTDVTKVIDVIGPQIAPSIADCVGMLLDPSRFPGCKVMRIDLIECWTPSLDAFRPSPALA